LVVLLSVSGVITFGRSDAREIYEAMGLVGPQLEMLEKMGLLRPSYMIATTLGGLIPFVVLLLWALPGVRRNRD
jgi:hypothetical protein